MPGRTAILVVNGFDRIGLFGSTFDAADAVRYPWIDLCLREVARRSVGSEYDVFVWDNSQMPALRAAITRWGARMFPSDEVVAGARIDPATTELVNRLVLQHANALETLWSVVGEGYDYLITLDSDAFPVRDGWIAQLQRNLGTASLTGIWRDEMPGALEAFVHPSGLAIRCDRLRAIPAPFALAAVQSFGQQVTQDILLAGEKVIPLRRSNFRNAHFLMGGIYGDLIYHHGAGSRRPLFRMTEGEDRDERVYARLRELVFEDVDTLIAVLRGDSNADLGLAWDRVEPRVWTPARWSGPGVRKDILYGEVSPAPVSPPPPAERSWLEDLPEALTGHVEMLRAILNAVQDDPRMRALQVQGSIGRGTADRLSDLDVGVVVADSAWPAVADDVPRLVSSFGEVVDSYYQLLPGPLAPQQFRGWAQFADGVQLDLLLLPSSRQLGSGLDGRTLYDPDQILLETDHPERIAGPVEMSKWSFLCWGALAEVAKFLERRLPVAAAEWMSPARQATISAWGAAHGLDYSAYANVVAGRLGISCPWPDGLEKTYPRPELDSVMKAALALAELQSRVDRMLDLRLGIRPRPLAAWVTVELERVQGVLPRRDSRRAQRSAQGKRSPASGRSD
jgi:hypothetical protein